MSLYTRGAGARKHQLTKGAQLPGKSKAGVQPAPRNDNRREIRFKLTHQRKGLASLTANGKTLAQMHHWIKDFSKADLTFIHVRMDGAGSEIELVTNRDLEPFVLERLEALGTQLK